MKYEDKKYGFSIELPDDWKKHWWRSFMISLLRIGGACAFKSPDNKAKINVCVGKIDNEAWIDKGIRRIAVCDFLSKAPASYGIEEAREIEGFSLDGEENTVYYRHYGPRENGRIISSFHNGIEYIIQSADGRNNEHFYEISGIIDSFKFKST